MAVKPQLKAVPEHGHESDPAAVGNRVRALREAMSLSLRDLADRTGVSAPDALAGRTRRDQPDAQRRRPYRVAAST